MASGQSNAERAERKASGPLPVPGPASQSERRVLLTDPDGAAAESIRVLRTRLQSQHLQLGRRALAICGPTPEVGATFVAVNLAISLSQIGVKTLLVDADLRNPSVHTYFEPKLVGGGLFACLTSFSDSIAEFTDENVLPNLDVLRAGQPDSAAHELLSGDKFPESINNCLRDYDMTIIDTPPANSCADGLRVSTVTGFALIVTRKNHTLVSDVRVLADQLRTERARAIGTVLNNF
ncbi:CpsD/CapB family tyrosine-protein kinase [Phenylobacterium sp.]|jgi:protein-tyrosine kinase|uniref:CpsD/CapB family tyrosine-protein kinase n=1 Tax=Phenylobacterium sp. TaxID=1871053 RepID=UPI0037C95EE5